MRRFFAAALAATAMSSAAAGSAGAVFIMKVRLVDSSESGACQSDRESQSVSCELRVGALPPRVLSSGHPWGLRGPSDGQLLWTASDGSVLASGALASAWATSRVVTYNGLEFIEMTLSW
jgi:hypothetical protein